MAQTSTDKRREPRFQIQVRTVVSLPQEGETADATTVNISGCGVLLEPTKPVQVEVGDPVSCDFSLATGEGVTSLPRWAEGVVVRLEGTRIAVDFRSGGWTGANTSETGPDKPR